MIKLFGQNDRDFSSNGDKIILPNYATIHKEDNGDYYLDLTTSLEYINDMTEGRIVVANTPQGDQAFRIGNVTKSKHKITAKCWHVYYDSDNYLIEDSRAVNMNMNAALDHFNSNTVPESPFTTLSDIDETNTLYIVRKSLNEAIAETIGRWGKGHLVRNNFAIEVRDQIGQDNGVTVRYGKNIKSIVAQYYWNNVVTQLLPVGYDGITLEDKYVYADIEYNLPYTKCVHFDQNINPEDYKDEDGNLDEDAFKEALRADLFSRAQNYIKTNQYPLVNYQLSANLEKITDIGDIIEVIDERLGINITTHVIAFDYDCILEKYTNLQFGNFGKNLSKLLNNITEQTQQMVDESAQTTRVTLTNELNEATGKIWSAMSDSHVIYDGDKILVVDSLPKETATNVIMINSGGIAFSQTGITGTFNSAWTIDGTLDMQNINVINLTADLIKGGTLRLGSNLNQDGILEIYDSANTLVGRMDNTGLKMYGKDGSYVLMNQEVGFAGYDRNDNPIYWVSQDEFHMKKSVVEQEITLCGKLRFIPITITNNGTVVNDGIGLVSVGSN